jgi:phage FluMu protein Com
MPANGKIHFRCPHCDKALNVAEAHAGKRAKCPRCGKSLQVPATERPTRVSADKTQLREAVHRTTGPEHVDRVVQAISTINGQVPGSVSFELETGSEVTWSYQLSSDLLGAAAVPVLYPCKADASQYNGLLTSVRDAVQYLPEMAIILINTLASEGFSYKFRSDIAAVLRESRVHAATVPTLLTALQTVEVRKPGNGELKKALIRALGKSGDPRAIEPLFEELRRDRCCVDAIVALGELRNGQVVQPLINLLPGQFDKQLDAAAAALAHLGDRRAVEPLITKLAEGGGHQVSDALDAIDPDWRRTPRAMSLMPPLLPSLAAKMQAVGGRGYGIHNRDIEHLLVEIQKIAALLEALGDASALRPLLDAALVNATLSCELVEAAQKILIRSLPHVSSEDLKAIVALPVVMKVIYFEDGLTGVDALDCSALKQIARDALAS